MSKLTMARRIIQGDPRVAISYVRVSRESQELGPEAQRAAIEAWAERNSVAVVAVYEDLGVSGGAELAARPGMLAALRELRANGAGVLIAAKRDRIARDVLVAATIEKIARDSGAVVLTADGSSDGESAEAQMMRSMLYACAAFERDAIRQRTRAALAVKRIRRERIGTVPYGFRVGADGVHLEEDPSEQLVLSAVDELRAAHRSQRGIARELAARGMFSRSGRPFTKTQIARMRKGKTDA